jgi:hypothetical protein
MGTWLGILHRVTMKDEIKAEILNGRHGPPKGLWESVGLVFVDLMTVNAMGIYWVGVTHVKCHRHRTAPHPLHPYLKTLGAHQAAVSPTNKAPIHTDKGSRWTPVESPSGDCPK